MKRRMLAAASACWGILLFAAPAWAQHDPGRWEDLLSGHAPEYRARYAITPYAEEPVKNQPTDFSILEQELSLSALVWEKDHVDVRLNAGVRYEGIQTGAILPNTGLPFPDELWNVNLGVTGRYLFESGSALGASVSVGSASDEPFHSSAEIVESFMIFFKLPAGGQDAWFFALMYSNNREFANSVPIPSVEYLYHPSREFEAFVGFPVEFIEWRPTDELSLRILYTPIHNIHAVATYTAADWLRLYAGFDWNTEGYLLVDRPDSADRFFYDEKRAKGGVRLLPGESWIFDLSGGYAFNRNYRESDQGLRSPFDRVFVGSGAYALFSLEWRMGHARDRFEQRP